MVPAGHEAYSHGLKGQSYLVLSLFLPEFDLEGDKTAYIVPYSWEGEGVPGWLGGLQGAVVFSGHNPHRRPCALVGQECPTDDLQSVCLVAGGLRC